jgi:hypothetical protein
VTDPFFLGLEAMREDQRLLDPPVERKRQRSNAMRQFIELDVAD